MNSEWKEVRLGDLISLRGGLAYKGEHISQSGTPMVTMGCVDPGSRFKREGLKYYRGSFGASHTAKSGEIVIATRDVTQKRETIGCPCLIPDDLGSEEAVVATNTYLVTNNSNIDNSFLYLLLKSPSYREQIVASAKGSTVIMITKDAIENHSFLLPPPVEQKAIAHILGTLDDKIELNRKTNETLEAMAKTLFKSWFMDFDPVRAKTEGRSTGLPIEISDLFPDSFEDSELGDIPSGWSISTIGNAVGEVFDGPHATPKEASDGYVFLGIKNMTGTSLDLSEKRWIGLDDWEQWTKRVVPTCGDIVFTYEAALGLFAVIPSGLTCCLGRRMALIRPRGNEPTPYFWFHQFVAEPFQRLIEERSIHGATVNRTPLTEFPQYPVLFAPIEIRNLFDLNAAVLWSRIHLGLNEIGKLAFTRDALLPKLISGEIRIPDAEKILEEIDI